MTENHEHLRHCFLGRWQMNSENNDGINSRNDHPEGFNGLVFSRREFLLAGGVMASVLCSLPVLASPETPLIIMEDAQGLIIGDPSKCVGCLRCELACTEFNDGKAAPGISRIKVGRNLNFGPDGPRIGTQGLGSWGNGLIIQDTCKQCPHPVPCANACPNDAIVLADSTNARVVDPKKCVGCKMCLRACPWDMLSYDPATEKTTKCFLCDGAPKCVTACPSGALSYIHWRDLTKTDRPRISPTAVVTPQKATTCNTCHQR